MSPIGSDWSSYLLILVVACIAHEPWRWLGAFLGRNIGEQDALFLWVRAVSTALVTGLVMRFVMFPVGVLETVPIWIRLLSVAISCASYFVLNRNLGLSIIIGCATLTALGTLT
ncbi:MAG: AzlD domain-containing protein [Hyphomicrobiaceae bacterium]